MNGKSQPGQERRRYVRLDSVFPVEFQLISLEGKQILSDWLQGFTNNVSKGGICLSVNNLRPELATLLKDKQAKLSLDIEMPIIKSPVKALAKVAWIREVAGTLNKHLIGLSYEEIDPLQNNKIMRYALTKKLFVPVVLSIILFLGLGFGINAFINIKLIEGNKALVEQLVKIVQDSSVAKQEIKEISKEKEDLQLRIQALEMRIRTAEEEKTRSEELSKQIEELTQEKAFLQDKLIAVQQKEGAVAEELLRLDKRKATLQKANLDKMYQWIKVHQNLRTGLTASFEGDSKLADWAFIYDQALLMQIYTNFSDFSRAKKIIDFFNERAKRTEGMFVNAYYVNDGQPAEYAVHTGPNIWLGIGIIQYTKRSQDKSYLKLAEEIADTVINLQDNEGGIRGGPDIAWYSTEHNLDAYAFFNMLYAMTGKQRYLERRDKVLDWLLKHTYDKTDVPIKRGMGDSTISTDTYAWSIAAIGPQRLEEVDMNPDRILEFVEQNCVAEASYNRPVGQTVKIKGFDFAPKRHVARGGVISSEWTAQMVIAYKIMADYYYKKNMIAKARTYALKADEYLSELANIIIASPSPSGQGEGCLPYATQDYIDTGHGWMTPQGSYTCSVAGTAYMIFAYYNYNPLELKD
jgi:hypothetical protein